MNVMRDGRGRTPEVHDSLLCDSQVHKCYLFVASKAPGDIGYQVPARRVRRVPSLLTHSLTHYLCYGTWFDTRDLCTHGVTYRDWWCIGTLVNFTYASDRFRYLHTRPSVTVESIFLLRYILYAANQPSTHLSHPYVTNVYSLIIVTRANTELMGPDDDDKIVYETHSPNTLSKKTKCYLVIHVLDILWFVKTLPDPNYLRNGQ